MRERDRLLNSYFPQRTAILLGQLVQAGLYPKLEAPEFNRHGGTIPRGFELSMSAPAGAILFTLDGGDPRLAGGKAAPGALAYSSSIPLLKSALVKARAREGAVWSALNEAAFILETPPPLRLTELMYHPPDAGVAGGYDAEEFEFVELKNIGAETLDLAGFRLAGGVDFEFSAGTVRELSPGAFLLVVSNLAAFRSRYLAAGLSIAGEYEGRLDNGGERLRLEGPLGETILDFAYDDAWHPSTDGGGFSLAIADPLGDPKSWNEAASWRPSRQPGGSPGRDDGEEPAGGAQVPSDLNQDRQVDLSDVVSLLGHLFLGDPAHLPCGGGTASAGGNRALLDANADADVDITDAVYLLKYLFLGGSPPFLGIDCVRMAECPASCDPRF